MNIDVNGLSIEIAGIEIIRDVSFDIPDKSLTCVIGPNGSGKSTILKAIAQEITGYKGQINGINLGELSYLPQSLEPPPFLTIFDVACTGLYGKSMTKEEEYASTNELLYQCGVYPVRKRNFADTSAGEQQRTWLAFALAQSSDLILMDEPLSSVDLPSKRAFYQLLRDVSILGKTLVVVGHDIDMIVEYCHHIIYIDKGTKMFEGDPKAFREWYW